MAMQSFKRKKISIPLIDRKKNRPFKNLAIAKPLSARQASKEVEEELEILKQQIEFILGVTKTGLDIIDSEFNIRYIDAEWATVYGDPTGKKCYEYFMEGSVPCPGCGIPKALKTKKPLVEDHQSVRSLAHRTLQLQGYTILEASNGEEALRVAQDHAGEKIHLLFTDVVMPHLGGKELSDQLKFLRPDIKVLYTSGYTDNAIVHQGVLQPGTYILQKPFSPQSLSQKVREVLDK